MLVEVLKPGATEDDDPQTVERIEIIEIATSRVSPVNDWVSSPIAIAELADLLTQIKPIEPLDSEELDSYHAQDIEVWRDGNLFPAKIDFPHHIGLHVVLRSILQKYGTVDNLQIEIS